MALSLAGAGRAYVAYHDDEWGVPEFNSRALFEKLVLDGFQAGLSWISILRKRENFRARLRPVSIREKIAAFDAAKIESLMRDAGIIRNRAKIDGAVASAQGFTSTSRRTRAFQLICGISSTGGRSSIAFRSLAEVPAQTPASQRLAKDLKSRGFKFCGPTIIYAFMQAVGMVNDHLVDCHRHEACQAAFRGSGRG